MATQIPPQQPPKKSNKAGWGCLGCGCVVVLVIVLLIVGLIGGGIYMGFKELSLVSSATPETMAPFTESADDYANAQKKIAAFNADVSASKTSTLTLSSDEINALIYHSVDPKKYQAQALVTLTGDTGRVQGTIPSNVIPFVNWSVKNRYFNVDATTGVSLNPDTKDVEFQFKSVQFGDIILPPNSLASFQTQFNQQFKKVQFGDITLPANSLASFQLQFNQQFNLKLHQNASVETVLQAAKSVSIKDGQLVVETK